MSVSAYGKRGKPFVLQKGHIVFVRLYKICVVGMVLSWWKATPFCWSVPACFNWIAMNFWADYRKPTLFFSASIHSWSFSHNTAIGIYLLVPVVIHFRNCSILFRFSSESPMETHVTPKYRFCFFKLLSTVCWWMPTYLWPVFLNLVLKRLSSR